jgi:diguanylate cyclase (GGDEF)-like protein
MPDVKTRCEDSDSPVPPFTLRDAEEIVRRLRPALKHHSHWVERIHAHLVCRVPPDEDDLQRDGHLGSDLGRWLREETNEYIRRHPEYQAAIALHRDVHILARSLCEAVHRDERILPEEYKAFRTAIDRFEESMEALVRELWDLLHHTDPLTGVATRPAMLTRLKGARERTLKTGQACTVCMVDLDRFKQINDTYGHRSGDAVLEAVSAHLAANLRRHDQVCRYGGEEFVLMLPDTDVNEALPVVDRLRQGLARLPIDIGGGTIIHTTASFGIAPLLADEPVEDSIDHADQAMYQAKSAGRNRVRIWQEG